jgi:hypothetical protein
MDPDKLPRTLRHPAFAKARDAEAAAAPPIAGWPRLDREELACAGLRRVDDNDRDLGVALLDEAAPAPRQRRVRRQALQSLLKQVWKAARAAGVPVIITIEAGAGKVTASQVASHVNQVTANHPNADVDGNEWDREYGANPSSLRQ